MAAERFLRNDAARVLRAPGARSLADACDVHRRVRPAHCRGCGIHFTLIARLAELHEWPATVRPATACPYCTDIQRPRWLDDVDSAR